MIWLSLLWPVSWFICGFISSYKDDSLFGSEPNYILITVLGPLSFVLALASLVINIGSIYGKRLS